MAWSPSGALLAFIDGAPSPLGAIVGPLTVSAPDGNEQVTVSDSAIAFFWAPDGKKLLYFEPYLAGSRSQPTVAYRVFVYGILEGRGSQIATMRPAPSFAREIVPFFDQYHQGYTIWSPGGASIVLNTVDDAGTEVIHLVQADGSDPATMRTISFGGTRYLVDDDGSDGLVAPAGVSSRILAPGSLPFFSGR